MILTKISVTTSLQIRLLPYASGRRYHSICCRIHPGRIVGRSISKGCRSSGQDGRRYAINAANSDQHQLKKDIQEKIKKVKSKATELGHEVLKKTGKRLATSVGAADLLETVSEHSQMFEVAVDAIPFASSAKGAYDTYKHAKELARLYVMFERFVAVYGDSSLDH